jgi:hypothetical protein
MRVHALVGWPEGPDFEQTAILRCRSLFGAAAPVFPVFAASVLPFFPPGPARFTGATALYRASLRFHVLGTLCELSWFRSEFSAQ